MDSIDPTKTPAKILLIGKQGHGKTGAVASLVAAGYKLRMIDTDKGANILRSLLTDPHYPYAKIMAANGLTYETSVSIAPISIPMGIRTVHIKVGDTETTENILAPKNANAWLRIGELLNKWKVDGKEFGGVGDWGSDVILDFDTLSTMAKMTYYFSQSLNSRLGAREQGFSHMQDINGAQNQLSRLLELLADDNLRCNVIVNSHIIWIDENRARNKTYDDAGGGGGGGQRQGGGGQSPGQSPPSLSNIVMNWEGFPEAIGQQLSQKLGKHFNDVYNIRQSGSGTTVKRVISTVPLEGIATKNSTWLEREYPQASGLASIFAALRGEPLPPDFVSSITKPGIATAGPKTQAS